MTAHDAPMVYRQHLQEIQRRATAALERGGFDHLVVPSGTAHYQVFDDRDYPYAVNPQFKAWVPLTRTPGSWLVHTPGERPRLIYLQPFDYWHAVPEAPHGDWVDEFDITIIRTGEEALQHLPGPPARCAILGEAQSALGGYVPNNPAPVLAYLDYHRARKTDYEIGMMRRASETGVRAHRAAERAFRAGASEFGIHLAYCQAARQDANDLPYGNIVGLNEHAAVLHYTERDRLPPRESRSFLIDAGASHAGYASDITRTYAADTGGAFQHLIDAVDAAEQRLCDRVRAGRGLPAVSISTRTWRSPASCARPALSTCPPSRWWKPASARSSSLMASATTSACRCTTWAGSRSPTAAARSTGPRATRSCA